MTIDSSNPETINATVNRWWVRGMTAWTLMPPPRPAPAQIVFIKYDSATGAMSPEPRHRAVYSIENLWTMMEQKPSVASLVKNLNATILRLANRKEDATYIRHFRIDAPAPTSQVAVRALWITRDAETGQLKLPEGKFEHDDWLALTATDDGVASAMKEFLAVARELGLEAGVID